MRLTKAKKGAGLIDVILTLFLLSVAGMIFAAVFPTCFQATRQAQEFKIATALAECKMEQLRAMNYESLNQVLLKSGAKPIIDSDSTASPYTFTQVDKVDEVLASGTGELIVEDKTSDTKYVMVGIYWKSREGTDRKVELNTLFVDKRTRKMN